MPGDEVPFISRPVGGYSGITRTVKYIAVAKRRQFLNILPGGFVL